MKDLAQYQAPRRCPFRSPGLVLKGQLCAPLPHTPQNTHWVRSGDFCPLQAIPEHGTRLPTLEFACPWKPGPRGKVMHFEEIPFLFRGKDAAGLRLKAARDSGIQTQSLLKLFWAGQVRLCGPE